MPQISKSIRPGTEGEFEVQVIKGQCTEEKMNKLHSSVKTQKHHENV